MSTMQKISFVGQVDSRPLAFVTAPPTAPNRRKVSHSCTASPIKLLSLHGPEVLALLSPGPRATRRTTSRRSYLFLATTLAFEAVLLRSALAEEKPSSAYELAALKDGALLSLSKFSGKVTLFVNVATYCALTPQYEGLVALHDKFKSRGFEIIASPCDQFRHQEPGSNQEVCAFAKEKFGVRFLLLDKLNVNDASGGVSPLYQFLRNNSPEATGKRVSWNFEKFLVGTDGHVLRRYKPGTLPAQIEGDIEFAVDHPGQALPPKKKPTLGVA